MHTGKRPGIRKRRKMDALSLTPTSLRLRVRQNINTIKEEYLRGKGAGDSNWGEDAAAARLADIERHFTQRIPVPADKLAQMLRFTLAYMRKHGIKRPQKRLE